MNFPEITDTLGELVLVLLALSTLLLVAEAVGLLPSRLSKWLARNRLPHTLEILREMGIEPKEVRKAYARSRLRKLVPFTSPPGELEELLQQADLRRGVKVGRTRAVPAETFLDVMGRTTDPRYCKQAARVLATHLRELGETETIDAEFSMVLGLKGGSPLLAYELASLLGKPLVLHLPVQKFGSDLDSDVNALFDVMAATLEGTRLLLVDDSTTGGTMAVEAIEAARRCGATVSDMLVLFVPPEKDPAQVLRNKGVSLYSVRKT